ncbi:hypothetical protein JCM10914A_10390 [Paenibacillus sp. JCM 10914]|uniref:hypothetical protein n=1 Tax=Paenibacillus sp. JCM 10914 TaxID=1236974 RepID=UPI0003CC674E|nr:hypothetical protein [Paenibacillus sp. JCM 10914]GAE07270.1 hypothetical protein JCM10914_3489 [Paenibacillus sp. JCM 10914]
MRSTLKDAVIGIVPALRDRVYDIHPPDGIQDASYAVLTLGEEVWKSAWAGYRQVIRLKLYGERSSLAAGKIVRVLSDHFSMKAKIS